MTTVVVTSAGASPGASALCVALGMAWCRGDPDRTVLVEADPSGGRLSSRFGLEAEPSLATYVSDARRGATPSLILRNIQRVGSLAVLHCPADPELARQVLNRGARDLAQLIGQCEMDAVVDLGRLDQAGPAMPFAVLADQVLIVTRPRFDEVQALLFRRRLLAEAGCNVGLVTVGDEPHRPREVAAAADLPLMAALPDDPRAAWAFCGGRFTEKRLTRTRLWKSVLALGDGLRTEFAERLTPVPPLPDGRVEAHSSGAEPAAPASISWPPAPRENPPTADFDVEPAVEVPLAGRRGAGGSAEQPVSVPPPPPPPALAPRRRPRPLSPPDRIRRRSSDRDG